MASIDDLSQKWTAALALPDVAQRKAALEGLRSQALSGKSAAFSDDSNTEDPKDYTALISNIDKDLADVNRTIAAGNKPNSLTTAPTPGSEADQKLGFENQRLTLQNQGLQNAADNAQRIADLRQQALNNTITWHQALDQLNTIKAGIDQQKADDLATKNDQTNAETKRHNLATEAGTTNANATNLMGHETSQSNQRSSDASSRYNSAVQNGLAMFKGAAPGQGAVLANGIQALLNGGQDYVNQSPGASPVAFTQDHYKQLLALVNSGTVPPDAQGNVVPNAIKVLAKQLPVGGNSDSNRYAAQAAATPPQFTAPAVA